MKTHFTAKIGSVRVTGVRNAEPLHSYVSTDTQGKRGGFYPGETFFNREAIESFILELRNAADVAFGKDGSK